MAITRENIAHFYEKYKENLKTEESVIEQFIADGYDVVFAASPVFLEACVRQCAAHPGAKILNCSLLASYHNVRSYYLRVYEAKFILGAIAASLSETDEIGYIADYPIYGTPASINAFALGAQLVNPRAKIVLEWSTLPGHSPEAALAARGVTISFGVDTPCQVTQAEQVFAAQNVSVPVLIEIEVGENRSGVIEEADFLTLLDTLRTCPHVIFGGIFSHDGNSYGAADLPALLALSEGAQRRTLRFAALAAAHGMPCRTVSYGATPTFMNHVPILPGITELRPGTYALMDASQGHAIGTLDRCAATVLATVISKPTDTRTILDVGAKGLTMQSRTEGICAVPGKGTLYDCPEVHIEKVFDEHAIILDRAFHDRVQIGQKVRVIPVHICPVCNLYDQAYLISGDDVVQTLPIAGRGKLQ